MIQPLQLLQGPGHAGQREAGAGGNSGEHDPFEGQPADSELCGNMASVANLFIFYFFKEKPGIY